MIPLAIGLVVDYCAPVAAAYMAECAGGLVTAAFLTGMARGYNLDIGSNTFGTIDPMAGVFEYAGMGLGVMFAIRPDRLVSRGIATGGKAIANFASRELTGTVVNVTKTALETKVTRSYTWFSSFCVNRSATNQVAQRTFQIAEGGVAKQGMQLCKQNPSNKISQVEGKLSEWLGKETKMVKNKAGDPVFLSKDTERRVRFDFSNPHGDRPHMHIEIKINSKWKDATSQHRIYPFEG